MVPEHNDGETIYMEHLNRYIFAGQFAANKVVLDIACGTGYGSSLLKDKGAGAVIGIDISEQTVEYCRKKFSSGNMSFVVGSASRMPLKDNSIDVVVSFETIEHLNEGDQQLFVMEIQRVLRPDGVLIMSTPNVSRTGHKNAFHIKELSYEEYRKLLSDKFGNTVYYYQDNVRANYILSGENVNALNFFLGSAVNASKLSTLNADNSLFIISVSSNSPVPRVTENISILNYAGNNGINAWNKTGIEKMPWLKRIERSFRNKYLKPIKDFIAGGTGPDHTGTSGLM